MGIDSARLGPGCGGRTIGVPSCLVVKGHRGTSRVSRGGDPVWVIGWDVGSRLIRYREALRPMDLLLVVGALDSPW
jgi:hypothetical protein